MNHRMWSGKILLKYSLIQLPAIVVFVLLLMLARQWISIPAWVLWCLIGLWVAKDLILYPFVWRAYEWDPSGKTDLMTGLRGIAKEKINPSGYVFVRGELWQARVIEKGVTIEKGETVVVKERQGLTLVVERASKEG